MALEENQLVYSYEAAGAIRQHRFVTFVNDGGFGRVAEGAAAGGYAFGVCLNKPTAQGHATTVSTYGQAMVEAGGAFDAGDTIGMDAEGRAVAAAAGNGALGIAVDASTGVGQIASVFIALPAIAAPV